MTSLAMHRGDDRTLAITASESLTGAAVTFSAARRKDADPEIVKTSPDGGITIGDSPADTIATVTLAAADTEGLDPGPLFWDVQVVDESGLTHTVATGILLLKTDVTRA